MNDSQITGVITSCGRHDLLRQTIESLAKHLDLPFRETIIIEDGPAGRPDWLPANSANLGHPLQKLGPITWISNGERRGQVYSIDVAYEQVKTEFIFHGEDDWQFTAGGFIQPSLDILRDNPDVLQVLLGDYNAHPSEQLPNRTYRTKTTDWRGWGGFSWNPGLRRRLDYDAIGSYGRYSQFGATGLGPEFALSQLYALRGYRVGVLPDVSVRHLGDGRSVHSRPQYASDIVAKPPKALIIIPACHTYEYGSWVCDVHQNGDSQRSRIQACRDTWLKDVAAHSPELQYRFFYGQGGTRIPEPDEVFLDCPDEYNKLPVKVWKAIRWARDNGFDAIYKCDDDTFVWVDRLYRDMCSPEWGNQNYYGYKHGHGYVTGGAGYVLRGRALNLVAGMRENDIEHWAEDITMYKFLDKHNVQGVYHSGHQPGFSEHWYDISKIDASGTAVTQQGERVALRAIHAVKPEDMRSLYARLYPQ
jgi:hypothetical protein